MLYVLLQQPEVYESLYANILSRLQTAYNLELRFQIWRSLLGYEWFNPLCGAGGVDPREVVLSEAGRFITPHNSYISFIFDFGLIGFIPLVMSWFTTLSNLYRASRDYLFVSSLFIGCLSYLIFIFSIADPQGFYLFMLLALSLKMPRILGEER